MAMLAEPRRKLKLSKDPNNLNWSNDDDKFGKRMLERMGWQKGKGLGANEDGKVDHIAVRVKNDNTGVGCSKKHADNWIAHQDDFNSLLANLNADHSNSGTSTPAEKVISLENHSKTSKGRVHYKKFTRGKDLSGKNLVDLDCVFGRRKSKTAEKTESNDDASNKETDSGKDTDHGVNTTVSKQSVQEYFAQKMADLQRLRSGDTTSTESGGTAGDHMLGKCDENSGSSELGVRFENVEEEYRPSFGSRLDHVDDRESESTGNSEVVNNQGVVMKPDIKEEEELGDVCREVNESEGRKKKGKKEKKKRRSTGTVCDGDVDSESIEPSKKKRKKDRTDEKSIEMESVDDSAEVDNDSVIENGKKKKIKKQKLKEEMEVEVAEADCDKSPAEKKRKKKKKGKKEGKKKGQNEDVVVSSGRRIDTEEKKKEKKENKKEGKNATRDDKKLENVDCVKTNSKKRQRKKKKKKGKNMSPVKVNELGKKQFKGANILEIDGYRKSPSADKKKTMKKKTG